MRTDPSTTKLPATEKPTEFKATRDGFGEGLVALGHEDKNVVVLTADLKESTRISKFAELFPERFFDVGVAEQNLAAIASGLGVSGKIPFISSFAVFSPGRNWEQIRTTVAYNDSNVKIAGHHGGLLTGLNGATHQATEDIALMRVIPNMKVIVPCDAIEARKATIASAKMWGPVYLRFSRERSPIMTDADTPFIPGKANIIWGSEDPKVAIVATGPILYEALLAARSLASQKIGSIVINMHTVKPLDREMLIECAKRTKAVVTAEDHQITGGLGGAVAEVLAEEFPVPLERLGLKDVFGGSGEPKELFEKFDMTAKDIVAAAKKAIRRKK